MDIKEKIEEAVKKITSDDELKELFQKDPTKAVEKVIGVDLPDDVVEKIIAAVKAKLAEGKLAGAVDGIKKLFS